LLCKAAILVEGDSDELIVQKAYQAMYQGRLPIHDQIEVISVGTTFKNFLEIAKVIEKPISVMTDNDGSIESITKKYKNYSAQENIKICYDNIVYNCDESEDYRFEIKKGKKFNCNTLEPCIVRSNNTDNKALELFGSIFEKEFTNLADLHKYMCLNKTECALQIFEIKQEIIFPQYVLNSIKHVRNER
jgi:putative ATP-dependent endonuclease of OLD family